MTETAEQPAKPKTAKKQQEKHLMPLNTSRFNLSKHQFQEFNAIVPPGTTTEDIQDHRFWAHVAQRIRMYDEIRVVWEDCSAIARLLVTFKYSNHVRVQMIDYKELDQVDTAKATQSDQFEVRMKGPLKWCVVDRETGENVLSNIGTQAEAYQKLEEHLKVLNR